MFKEPTSCVDEGESGSVVGSSGTGVLPNSRHPVALWDNALGSLDFLENRLLKEEDRRKMISTDGRSSQTEIQRT